MKEAQSLDEQYMRKALDLARAGVGLVSPNPAVGAVVVDASGREVGSGTHTYDGVKHAEVLALEQAGDEARGCNALSESRAMFASGAHRALCRCRDRGGN